MNQLFQRIESRQNKHFKQWLVIATQSRGKKTDQVLIEGLRLCRDAVASAVTVEIAIVAASASPAILDFAWGLPEGTKRYTLPDDLFARLSDTDHPQGLALICRSTVLDGPHGPPHRDGLYLIADGLADPGNLGTLIRTADAFAFTAVLVTAGTVWPMQPKVIRAAMGACFHLPIIQFTSLRVIADWLKTADLPLIAADPQGSQTVDQLPAGGAALLIGNEAHGLSSEARSLADRLVRIPMPGRAESLNAAAAAAICAYELMQARQREDRPDPSDVKES